MVRRSKNRQRNNPFNNEFKDTYWQSANYNITLYDMLCNEIDALAVRRYKWINLPSTCDESYLERCLYYGGMATISAKSVYSEITSLKVAQSAGVDKYGYPLRWKALGDNGYQYEVTSKTGQIIYDNSLRISVMQQTRVWIRELVDIIRTMQQNRAHQKIPLIIYGNQDNELDLTNYVQQVAGGEVIMLATDGITRNIKVEALTTNIPFIASELWESYFNAWNQIYRILGISNLTFKAERQIEDEVQSQQEPSTLKALDGLMERRKALTRLQKIFPQLENTQVVWNSDVESDSYQYLHNAKNLAEMNDIA